MSIDELKLVVLSALRHLVNTDTVHIPITSLDLLTRVIAYTPPAGLLPDKPPPRLRLTDLSRFEGILETLAVGWDEGTLKFNRDNGEFTIMDISLASSSSLNLPKKRKRVIDEEADSAAGDEDENEETPVEESSGQPLSALLSLTKEQLETFTLIQMSTAKGRLLAQQVRVRLRQTPSRVLNMS